MRFFFYDVVWNLIRIPILLILPLSVLRNISPAESIRMDYYQFIEFLSESPEIVYICIAGFVGYSWFYYNKIFKSIEKWARDSSYEVLEIKRCSFCDYSFVFLNIIFPNYRVSVKDEKGATKNADLRFGYGTGIEKVIWKR